MTEERKKKQREYARKAYQNECEYLEKAFYKSHHITPKTDKEKILKVVCKKWLLASFRFGKDLGGSKINPKEVGAWERFFERGLGHALTLDLKKGGVLPLPKQGKVA